MSKTNGPRVTIKVSCTDCMHCDGEPYRCQGDSGVDYYCKEPSVGRKDIDPFATPAWCPLLPPSPRDAALEEAAKVAAGELLELVLPDLPKPTSIDVMLKTRAMVAERIRALKATR